MEMERESLPQFSSDAVIAVPAKSTSSDLVVMATRTSLFQFCDQLIEITVSAKANELERSKQRIVVVILSQLDNFFIYNSQYMCSHCVHAWLFVLLS